MCRLTEDARLPQERCVREGKGSHNVGRTGTHRVTSQALVRQLPETPTCLSDPSSVPSPPPLSETLQLKELSGLHHMELLPTLCFPRRLLIPPHKRILEGHLLTPGTGNTELHKVQLLPSVNSLSKGATDLKTKHSHHIKGCEGCTRPKDRDPPILPGGFGNPSQRR